ncbi:hypothetical protein MHYP_G00195370 [Metynnis hypsauchen]
MKGGTVVQEHLQEAGTECVALCQANSLTGRPRWANNESRTLIMLWAMMEPSSIGPDQGPHDNTVPFVQVTIVGLSKNMRTEDTWDHSAERPCNTAVITPGQLIPYPVVMSTFAQMG